MKHHEHRHLHYFLSQDNRSSDWYVIPTSHRSDWSKFLAYPVDDARGWELPAWATPVGGSPSLVIFREWTL